MQLQTAKRNDCMPVAFAIACNIPKDDFINQVGHQGYEIKWPKHTIPFCYRGWHIQECVTVAYNLGFACTEFYRNCELCHGKIEPVNFHTDIDIYMSHERTILITDTHAVACDGITVYDPKGKAYLLSDKSIYQIIILLDRR